MLYKYKPRTYITSSVIVTQLIFSYCVTDMYMRVFHAGVVENAVFYRVVL